MKYYDRGTFEPQGALIDKMGYRIILEIGDKVKLSPRVEADLNVRRPINDRLKDIDETVED
jgi:hypothetical protein